MARHIGPLLVFVFCLFVCFVLFCFVLFFVCLFVCFLVKWGVVYLELLTLKHKQTKTYILTPKEREEIKRKTKAEDGNTT